MAFVAMLSLLLIANVHAHIGTSRKSGDRFFQKQNNCLANITSPNYLVHLPTHEGLISHFLQLEDLWLAVINSNINKTIVSTPINSHHFHGVETVQLCDIFALPPEIQCSCASERDVAQLQIYCPMLDYHKSWSTNLALYGLNANQTKITMDVDLRKVTCVAGMVAHLRFGHSHYIKAIVENRSHRHLAVEFTQQYIDLADRATQLLGIHGKHGYLALHWRRGDQLTLRCDTKSSIPGQYDDSINCRSADEFVQTALRTQADHFNQTQALLPVYVATNEVNATTLSMLHRAGLLTSTNVTDALRGYVKLHEDDIFVLDMIMMCNAETFLHWGVSSVPKLVDKCRLRNSEKRRAEANV
jgi:hypothetical protein